VKEAYTGESTVKSFAIKCSKKTPKNFKDKIIEKIFKKKV
jgi:hypothetical protein